ncbi:MAG: S8 family serine peptidase, partial [Woeseiaceae bacterium]
MRRMLPFALVLLLLAAIARIALPPSPGPAPIYLQGGERVAAGTLEAQRTIDRYLGMARPPPRAYFVAQFARMPSRDERQRIESRYGVRFLDALPVNSYIISVPTVNGSAVLARLEHERPPATAIVDVREEDKISRELHAVWRKPADPENAPEYLRRPRGVATAMQTQVAVFVRFFADVPLSEQREILISVADADWDLTIRSTTPAYGVWALSIPNDGLGELTANPVVQSIEGAPPPAVDDMDQARPRIGAGAGYPETGSGVVIAQWELCQPDTSHPDLAGTLIGDAVRPQCQSVAVNPGNGHATMVAGILTGDGVDPAYRGVAPGAQVLSFDTGEFGPAAEYPHAQAMGATISSNSWGYAYDYDLYGNVLDEPWYWYPETAAFYDAVTSARNAAGDPSSGGMRMLVVASSGNEGDKWPRWWRTRIANSAKNVISVGNVSSGGAIPDSADLPAAGSGRGPTGDGRLSPLLVAPGIEVRNDRGITTTWPGGSYRADFGTSFSTPIVSAAAALLTERFRKLCPGRQPVPAELRALLAHTARDLLDAGIEAVPDDRIPHGPYDPDLAAGPVYAGPDFVFGYGLLRIDAALASLEQSHFVSAEIERGYIDFPVQPSAGDTAIKVTLAWDDPPFSANALPSAASGYLQNDLDLVVISPGGTRYYPWVLDRDE